MKEYSLGTETVPAAGIDDGCFSIIVGSVHDGRNYGVLLARMERGKMAKFRILKGKNDWEGHSIAKFNEYYLMGGAVEGRATKEGGSGWKAYLAKIDREFNIIWEKKIRLRGNEALYSILPSDNCAFIGGEFSQDDGKGFFVGKVDGEGNIIWLHTFGEWEDVLFSSLLKLGDRYLLVGSVNEGKWKVKSFEFRGNGEILSTHEISEGIAMSADSVGGKIILAGYRKNNLWVHFDDRNIFLENGSATSIYPTVEGFLVGGELKEDAVLLEFDQVGNLREKRILWKNGWVEVLLKNLVLGVRGVGEKTVMMMEV